MGIVDWGSNDLNTEERALAYDLLSVAIAESVKIMLVKMKGLSLLTIS